MDNLTENQRANREREHIAQEGHITERYTQAIEQLGSDKMEVRLGGIFALERLAKDSPRDYSTIMEVLTAYVRTNAPADGAGFAEPRDLVGLQGGAYTLQVPRPSADIQAVLTVLSRRAHYKEAGEEHGLDLRDTNLRGAHFKDVHFEGANFAEARLELTVFGRAWLTGANFFSARLNGAAFLVEDHLEGARFGGATLIGTTFFQTHLEGANFGDEQHPSDVRAANFARAHLEGADLRYAMNLTQGQVDQTFTDENTQLPEGIHRPSQRTTDENTQLPEGIHRPSQRTEEARRQGAQG